MKPFSAIRGVILASVVTLTFAGCSTSSMGVQMSSTANLNMNDQNEPLPVVVRVYQLSQAEGFNSASFKELWRNDLKTLGNALLVKEELVVDPAQTRTVEINRHDDVRYVGVVAVFREVNGESWKSITKVSESWLGRALGADLKISLKSNAVTIE